METGVFLEIILLLLQEKKDHTTTITIEAGTDFLRTIFGSTWMNDAVGYIMKLHHHHLHRHQACFSYPISFLTELGSLLLLNGRVEF